MARWAAGQDRAPGAILSGAQGWALAWAWYHDRLDPTWRRRPPAEAEAVFAGIGLTGPAWRFG